MEIVHVIPRNVTCVKTPQLVKIVGSITEEMYTDVQETLEELMTIEHLTFVVVLIDTLGGSVHYGKEIGRLFDMYKKEPYHKQFIGVCIRAHSMGAYIYAKTDERYMDPTGSILIHDVSMHQKMDGKLTDVLARVAFYQQDTKHIFETISSACGKSKEFIKEMVDNAHNANVYLDAEEAKRIGLVHYETIPSYQHIIQQEFILSHPTNKTNTNIIGTRFRIPQQDRGSRPSVQYVQAYLYEHAQEIKETEDMLDIEMNSLGAQIKDLYDGPEKETLKDRYRYIQQLHTSYTDTKILLDEEMDETTLGTVHKEMSVYFYFYITLLNTIHDIIERHSKRVPTQRTFFTYKKNWFRALKKNNTGILKAKLAEKDAEIERLRAELATANAQTTQEKKMIYN